MKTTSRENIDLSFSLLLHLRKNFVKFSLPFSQLKEKYIANNILVLILNLQNILLNIFDFLYPMAFLILMVSDFCPLVYIKFSFILRLHLYI